MDRHTAGAVVGAVALIVALAGCTPAAEGGAEEEELSPLNRYLSAAWGGDLSEEEQIESMEKDDAAREELIAQCMTEEGFEYIPASSTGSISFSSDDVYQPDSREWVAQYGYGMINYPGGDEQAEPAEEYVDPNQDYISSLSEAEQTAFYEVLYGPPTPAEEMNEDGSYEYEYDWTTAGCHGWAQHEMEGDDPTTSDEHKPLMNALNDFYTGLATAPELADVNVAWAACMDEGGYPGFSAQSDAQMSISDELNAYYENQTEWLEDDPALAELGEREIELALVDLECRDKTDYRAKSTEITVALEEQFIDDHQAELDAFVAAAEQAAR